MKKMTFAIPIVFLYAAFIAHLTSCSTINTMSKSKIANGEIITDDTQSIMPESSAKNYRNDINIKAVREFVGDFKEAKNVTWQKATDGGCIADFKTDSIKTIVWYNRGGSWISILKRYSENKMPGNLRALVKSNYFDHTIMEVAEIRLKQDRENIIFRILIKNADNFKILRVCNQDIEVVGDYNKP